MNKIKIYCDTGASISFLKGYKETIEFIQFPHDSRDRPKRVNMSVAKPSACRWSQANITYQEATFQFFDCAKSNIYSELEKLIGKHNETDVLHLDSAYKANAHIFLTSDKRDIWTKRSILEPICGFKIYYPAAVGEQVQVIEYIKTFAFKKDSF